jgi:hypothetical protein
MHVSISENERLGLRAESPLKPELLSRANPFFNCYAAH